MPKPGKRGRIREQTQAAREKQQQVLELSLRGLTFSQIAVQLGYKESSIRSAWQSAQRTIFEVKRDQLRKVHGERLQRMRAKVWAALAGREVPDPDNPGKKIVEYDYPLPDLIDRALRIDAREAKLFGLNASAREELSGPEGGPVSISAGVDTEDLKMQVSRLTTAEQTLYIRLTNKMEGRGVDEEIVDEELAERTGTLMADSAVPAVALASWPDGAGDAKAKSEDGGVPSLSCLLALVTLHLSVANC